ncbi:MAG: aldehyde-activating protein [SAR116 cluster bacterium]|uniref:GFA family protein n=1 Tax=Stappia sp. TaxID=1870903 RepID=UPI000C62E578|nr:GFA family protein [Stappia sp.]MAC08157.1 aldehyde-activating protein [SAR116 cluster bacterium]MBM21734.1 aldehyde-activating protein [Stappia sp.]
MVERLSGGCLCGKVRFSAAPAARDMGVCHCSMCRRWSGGAFMAVDCGDTVEFAEGAEPGVYVSSDYGERVFCAQCGSSLMWRMRDGSHASVSAQAFDAPEVFALTTEIFVDEQPSGYAFANSTRKMTGAEVFALYAPNQEPQHG